MDTTTNRRWTISGDACDDLNGKTYLDLESAKAAVVAVMLPDGDWEAVPGAPDSPENAWEYWAYDGSQITGEPDARLDFALVDPYVAGD